MNYCKEIFDLEEINQLYTNVARLQYSALPATLKIEQAQALHTILNKKDLVCILPTGYGKTLCMLLPSIIISQITKRQSTTLIISPLVALMHDKTESIKALGLTAIHVTNLDMLGTSPESHVVFILISPELLKKKESKSILMKYPFDLVAVDEGHTASEWGKTFRKDYSCLYEVRSFIDCPLAVYTATVTSRILNEVKKLTGIRNNAMETIAITPDRRNIFLETRYKKLDTSNLEFLIKDVAEMGPKCEKTIIFVQTKVKVTELFEWFHQELQDKGLYRNDGEIRGFTVDMYSSCTQDDTKSYILAEFKKKDSSLRILIATIAFGLGVDIPDIRRIIIWGLPSSPMALWQEIGRGARDGLQGSAIIFPERSAKKNVENSYELPRDECTRNYILQLFYGTLRTEHPNLGHTSNCERCNCCTYCKESCEKEFQMVHHIQVRQTVGMLRLLRLIAPAKLAKK